ncbi:outer membrane protein assembly factor [Flavobacterium sp.]|uniref:outer membrane protein assembly factor n=1 Tax=Flavobacterium sp. TaxID=239 RepID=UPI00375235AE
MKKVALFMFLLFTILTNSQSKIIESIEWKGSKKMNKKFMIEFIQSKVNANLDSLKLDNDVDALTRLNGISKVTYEVTNSNSNNYNVIYTIVEDFSIIPNLSLWTTDITTAYRIGLYDFNFLGRNNTIGGFYQYNGVTSFGFNYSAPFLFNIKFGLEASAQKLGSIEPIFFEGTKANYQYTNTAAELLGVYRINFRNSFKLGISIFNEDYEYQNGATSVNVPLELKVDKYLLKSNYLYDNLKYDYYLVKGFRNSTFFQVVKTSSEFQNNFVIGWNDLSYFKRVGTNGNWANRLRLGLSTNDITPFAPFSVDNNLNIRGVGNIIDRGTGTIVVNSEFRKTLYEKKWFVLQGNAFIDAGTWRQPGENIGNFFDKKNVRVYPGVGLRVMHKTIFNAIFRIDYGFGITENGSKGIVFGIGQYF